MSLTNRCGLITPGAEEGCTNEAPFGQWCEACRVALLAAASDGRSMLPGFIIPPEPARLPDALVLDTLAALLRVREGDDDDLETFYEYAYRLVAATGRDVDQVPHPVAQHRPPLVGIYQGAPLAVGVWHAHEDGSCTFEGKIPEKPIPNAAEDREAGDFKYVSRTDCVPFDFRCAALRPKAFGLSSWTCTRRGEHDGPHVAHANVTNPEHPLAAWADDGPVHGWNDAEPEEWV